MPCNLFNKYHLVVGVGETLSSMPPRYLPISFLSPNPQFNHRSNSGLRIPSCQQRWSIWYCLYVCTVSFWVSPAQPAHSPPLLLPFLPTSLRGTWLIWSIPELSFERKNELSKVAKHPSTFILWLQTKSPLPVPRPPLLRHRSLPPLCTLTCIGRCSLQLGCNSPVVKVLCILEDLAQILLGGVFSDPPNQTSPCSLLCSTALLWNVIIALLPSSLY